MDPLLSEPRPVYLDHAASAPLCAEALEAMTPYLSSNYANPSGVHGPARAARRALDDARDELAESLGCKGAEIVFTSGGTEADNLALLGTKHAPGDRVLVSAIEHHAVLRPAEALGAELLAVDKTGVLDLGGLSEQLAGDVRLVSVMAVNNELGVRQPLPEIAAAVRAGAPQALLHCDAVQALGWCELESMLADCDLISLSAHKFGGPRGVGALVVRERARARIGPVHLGGSQERDLRPGTENLAGAIGMAAAARVASRDYARAGVVGALKDELIEGIGSVFPEVIETVPRALVIAPIAHLRFPGLLAEELLLVLDELGVAAAAGSACASGALEASHVLLALGLSEREALQSIRFSLGHDSSAKDVAQAVRAVGQATSRLVSSSSSAREAR